MKRLSERHGGRSLQSESLSSRCDRARAARILLGRVRLELPGVLFELARVRVEFADPFAQLLDRHGIVIVHPAERLLVQVNLHRLSRLGGLRTQASRDLAVARLEL